MGVILKTPVQPLLAFLSLLRFDWTIRRLGIVVLHLCPDFTTLSYNLNEDRQMRGELFSPSNEKVPRFPFPSGEVQLAVSSSSPRIFTEFFHGAVEHP